MMSVPAHAERFPVAAGGGRARPIATSVVASGNPSARSSRSTPRRHETELDAVSRHWSCSRCATGCGARREPGHYCKSCVVERRTLCSIDLTQSIRPNVLRRVPVGTRRLGLRRGSPLLRVRKPTVGYVADLADLRAATDCLCRYTWAGYEKLNVQCRRWRVLPWYHWERFP